MQLLGRGCLKYALTLLVGGTLLLMLSCPLGGLAIQHGYIAPPTIHRRLGAVALHADSALDSQCPMAGCGARLFDPSLRQYYVVWIVITSNNAGNMQVTSHPLLMIPLRH